MESSSNINRDDTACDKCGAPASRADTSTSNLSWNQSLRHLLDTYFASPRMWPLGYILQSSYSPLWLEKEIPTHNWRDAFEDLLALESSGQMISLENRSKEAEVAKRIMHDSTSHHVSLINDTLKCSANYQSLFKRMRDLAARKKWADTLEGVAEAISSEEEFSKRVIASGEGMIATLKQDMGKSFPASRYKMRGHWMASLVSSGALPGWKAQLFDSSEGFQVSIDKLDGDPDDLDGQWMTESEIKRQFEEGIPMELGSPSWSTHTRHYPESEQVPQAVGDNVSITQMEFQIPPLAPSIVSQVTTVERTKSENGDLSTKVALRNLFTDGTIEHKEVIDDPSKVLEEYERVCASMIARRNAIYTTFREAQYKTLERQVKEHEENDELD